ncbi:MAG: phosphatidylserine decarboxylase [Desulfobacteraceae bacterium]|nr:phosphatidylserine decarboxylase [Desulfobacteraceae bacterium]
MPEDILIYNRRSGQTEIEQVYGRKWMDLFYGTAWGRTMTAWLLSRHPLSKLFGAMQQSRFSRRKIDLFTRQYGINLAEAEIPPGGFASFNDFFIRRLKPEARPVAFDAAALISPADSRLQVFTIAAETRLPIKGTALTLSQLLGQSDTATAFQGGLCLIFRLAPCDYHRFGYVDGGVQGPVQTLKGPLHSVSPLALRHRPNVHCTNFRQWCAIRTPNLGSLIQVEVGAMMVGSIVQHQPNGGYCRRGLEKGYFQFGGSTVILILEPNRVVIDADILQYSAQGIETLVRYGERVGSIMHLSI